MIILIWAMTKSGVIGINNRLPWNIKSEMQYFKDVTIDKTVLMGAKTFENIGKPLKNRYNIIVSNHPHRYEQFIYNDNMTVTNDISGNLKHYQGNKEKDICVIGGCQIYKQTWKFADYLYVSIIKHSYDGNVIFPILDFSDFKLVKTTEYQLFVANIYQKKEQK